MLSLIGRLHSVPGLLLELKRGRRVDAARRDRRRGAHDERDEGRAQNRLAGAAAELRDEPTLRVWDVASGRCLRTFLCQVRGS